MSESVNKEQKRRKMKLRRTRDLIPQEVLSHEDVASVKQPIRKVRKNKNYLLLPQIDDLFDSGIKANRLKENLSTASSSTSENDFKKPVVDKKVKALKTSTKVNCVGQSWLVESYTDMSSCADSAKENSFEAVSSKKLLTKKKKNAGSVSKNKPKITVLENVQLRPCFVLLDKMKHDVNDESFKFLPSNSSSPFLCQNVSDSKVLRRQSSLTKEMFEELPNWSKSDYWDVEDLVGKPKVELQTVLDIGNSMYELNRPSLNGTIDLSTSRIPLKNNNTFEIEKSLQNRSFTPTTKLTVLENQENIDVVDKSKLEDGIKSVPSCELNQSSMNSTINLSTPGKSLKNNSTFEIDKPLGSISRRQSQKKNSIHSQSSEKHALEVEDVVNKTTAQGDDGDDSKAKLTNSEKRKRFCQVSQIETDDENNCAEPPSSSFLGGNLLTDSEKRGKLKRHKSTFTANDNVTNSAVLQLPKPERKKWPILDENEKSSMRKSLSDSFANIFNSPAPIKRRTIGESSAKLERRRSAIFDKVNKKSPAKLAASFLNQESGFVSQTLDETSSTPEGESNVFTFDEKSSEASKSSEEESNVFSEQDQPEIITRCRSTLTLDDTVTDIDVLKSACDLYGSPKELKQRATKKSRRVTFKDDSVIVINDSQTSSEKESPIIEEITINDSENDSFTVTSTTAPCEPRHRISSDSFLLKKSIGLNHKIRLGSDDLTIKNKNLASASKSKLKKMPNFAKIHQKIFDKMPDIRQYSEKKKERAKLLLSGKKLPKHPELIVPVTKKQLFTASSTASTKSNFVSSTPNVNKKMIGYTRFGFQVAQRNVAAKQELIKAVANKARPGDALPRQRFKEELKGVRSNKRFELLMKMRNAT